MGRRDMSFNKATLLFLLAIGAIVCLCEATSAENRVRIGDVTTVMDTKFGVGVFVTNDELLEAFIVPLVVRSMTGGAFWDGYDDVATETSFDVRGGKPVDVMMAQDDLIDFVSPDQILIAYIKGFAYIGGVSPGTDEPDRPSVEIVGTANNNEGIFEIDTLLFPPATPLEFINSVGLSVGTVLFEKGAVSIIPCDCSRQGDVAPGASGGDKVIDLLDVTEMIDRVFRSGPPLLQDAACPSSRGDWDCNSVETVLDVIAAIDHVFRSGSPPCHPCGM